MRCDLRFTILDLRCTTYDLRHSVKEQILGRTNAPFRCTIYDIIPIMKEQILARTKAIGINALKLLNDLPNNPAGWAIAKQLARCSTSIGSNYRAAIRAKSDLDFINKLKIVEEETF